MTKGISGVPRAVKEAVENHERHILWSIPCRGWRTSFILETGSGPIAGIPPGSQCSKMNRLLLESTFSEGQPGVSAGISLWGALLSHSGVQLGWLTQNRVCFDHILVEHTCPSSEAMSECSLWDAHPVAIYQNWHRDFLKTFSSFS